MGNVGIAMAFPLVQKQAPAVAEKKSMVVGGDSIVGMQLVCNSKAYCASLERQFGVGVVCVGYFVLVCRREAISKMSYNVAP